MGVVQRVTSLVFLTKLDQLKPPKEAHNGAAG
jgi:hypothetical protein